MKFVKSGISIGVWFNDGMHIVRVAPLAALPNTVPQVLDYFWPEPLPASSVVKVTVGHRAVIALVLESLDLERAKLGIKKSSFGLKKISSVVTTLPQATAGQLAMARWMSGHYCAPLGLCLKTVLPSFIGKRGKILSVSPLSLATDHSPLTPSLILTQPDTALKEIRKQCNKATGQILIVVPEVSLAAHLANSLKELSPLCVHSEMKSTEYAQTYRTILASTPAIVIGTRLALFLPWQTLSKIIVEDPLHEAYKSDMTPRYAAPDAARHLSQVHGAEITYLSPALSTANRYLVQKNIFTLTDKKPHWPRIITADMSHEHLDGNHSILSRHAQDIILDAQENPGRSILLFSPRKAYATMVRCEHCNKAINCKTCDVPMRLHRTSEDMLVCYHCAAYMQVPRQCPACHAGVLKARGAAGSQKIAEAVGTLLDRHGFSKIEVPILDSDLIRTSADANRILNQLDTAKHPWLVATQMIFSHRYMRTFDHVIAVGADALTYNPDFRTQERLIYQLEKLADFKPQTLTLQSWDTTGPLAHASDRSWESFYDRELADRKALAWPPFTRLVKLTFSHRDRSVSSRLAATATERIGRAATHLGAAKAIKILGPTPALVERAGGRWAQHIILKTTLADTKLRELLSHIPSGGTIDIDPRSIT